MTKLIREKNTRRNPGLYAQTVGPTTQDPLAAALKNLFPGSATADHVENM